VDANLIGTVLNNVKAETGLYQYYASEEKTA